jgi:hypothetical protein
MQGGEAELLEADRQPEQLPRPPLHLHLEAGMASTMVVSMPAAADSAWILLQVPWESAEVE